MKFKYLLFFSSFFFYEIILSQSNLKLFPNDLLVQPFVANFLEPKIGVDFRLNENELKLNIGTSRDLLHYKISNDEIISAGADFFTFTKLRGETEFNFPVDAVDYLFGINVSNKIIWEEQEFGLRIRLSHISAHFVDGHFETKQQNWKNGREPIIYSREFIEIFPYYSIKDFRYYIGFTYLIHVVPKDVGKTIYQIGAEKFFENILIKNSSFFIAYDFRLNKINSFMGSNTFKTGIKFGKFNSGGVSLLFTYFSGFSTSGEYFDILEKYFSVGINVDL